jgi:hypothetical protein
LGRRHQARARRAPRQTRRLGKLGLHIGQQGCLVQGLRGRALCTRLLKAQSIERGAAQFGVPQFGVQLGVQFGHWTTVAGRLNRPRSDVTRS